MSVYRGACACACARGGLGKRDRGGPGRGRGLACLRQKQSWRFEWLEKGRCGFKRYGNEMGRENGKGELLGGMRSEAVGGSE